MKRKQGYTAPSVKTRMIYDYDSPLLEGSIDSNIGIGGGDIDNGGSRDPDAKGNGEGVSGSVWE